MYSLTFTNTQGIGQIRDKIKVNSVKAGQEGKSVPKPAPSEKTGDAARQKKAKLADRVQPPKGTGELKQEVHPQSVKGKACQRKKKAAVSQKRVKAVSQRRQRRHFSKEGKSSFSKEGRGGGFSKEGKSSFSKEGPRKIGKPVKAAGDDTIRLNKYIASSGICSRREADELISAGVITVNGKSITELGTKIKPGDDVRYNGKTDANRA